MKDIEMIKILVEEVEDSLNATINGIDVVVGYDIDLHKDKIKNCRPSKGIGSKAYTIRRIDILMDKLKEVKQNLIADKYKYIGDKND